VHRIRYIVLPNAAPQIFAGARTALAIGMVAMVISEMVGTPGGIGYFILNAQRAFDIPAMWTGIIALGILGYLLNKLFGVVERRVLIWHYGMMAHQQGGGA
jgi:ABC-type nitrate/sulfonate/bicarbonate transport system permease component